MPGRVEELYKMHLIIAPRWMREINGFPFSGMTVSAFFFFSSKPQFVTAVRYSPARFSVRPSPFTLSSYALVNPSTGRAGNKDVIWIRDYIAAMKSNFSIHGTMDLFDTASAISHFSRMKSFPRAGLSVSGEYPIPIFFAFNMLFKNNFTVWDKHLYKLSQNYIVSKIKITEYS